MIITNIFNNVFLVNVSKIGDDYLVFFYKNSRLLDFELLQKVGLDIEISITQTGLIRGYKIPGFSEELEAIKYAKKQFKKLKELSKLNKI